ncbi:CdaR family transcriptional regulator [Oceanobacillus halophilus]|uniref:Sugar diacid utilization regulator n=1 Tax=Oceanobacillus halophilus TaxID=930130 RepID=A0A495A467_9BACI|nr:sugar diacid recognition domain-containing protein [Oceanobacillus halophilus]RKQ34338.1 sugar diacid utilization regulator [Oceanobacillus halophilus]
MEVSPTLAQEIVTDMKGIINQDLNFIDTRGIVIASTNIERINTDHEGARKVLATKMDLIIERDEQFKGARKGINIPIYFENNIVGVIGITGEKEEVTKFGQIIKKMTEILVKDAWLKNLTIQRRENNRMIVDYLLFQPESEQSKTNINKLFEVDLNKPRIIIIGKFVKKVQSSHHLVDRLNSIFEKYVLFNQENFFTIKGDEIILILDHRFENDMERTLNHITKETKENLGIELSFGIGSSTIHTRSIKQSYQQAKSAINWANSTNNQRINYFKDLDIGLILNRVSTTSKQYYVDKVLSNLCPKELREYGQMIEVYGKNNGSINKTAEELFIHKNTLQYKLNKLAKLTEYNPRILNDYVILRIAFLLIKKDVGW